MEKSSDEPDDGVYDINSTSSHSVDRVIIPDMNIETEAALRHLRKGSWVSKMPTHPFTPRPYRKPEDLNPTDLIQLQGQYMLSGGKHLKDGEQSSIRKALVEQVMSVRKHKHDVYDSALGQQVSLVARHVIENRIPKPDIWNDPLHFAKQLLEHAGQKSDLPSSSAEIATRKRPRPPDDVANLIAEYMGPPTKGKKGYSYGKGQYGRPTHLSDLTHASINAHILTPLQGFHEKVHAEGLHYPNIKMLEKYNV
jgi:hypothetical protein